MSKSGRKEADEGLGGSPRYCGCSRGGMGAALHPPAKTLQERGEDQHEKCDSVPRRQRAHRRAPGVLSGPINHYLVDAEADPFVTGTGPKTGPI